LSGAVPLALDAETSKDVNVRDRDTTEVQAPPITTQTAGSALVNTESQRAWTYCWLNYLVTVVNDGGACYYRCRYLQIGY